MDSFWSSPLTGLSLVALVFISSSDFDGISSMVAHSLHEGDYRVYLFLSAFLVPVASFIILITPASEKLESVDSNEPTEPEVDPKDKEIHELKLALGDYRRVCAERERTLGKDHPNTATQYNNIGAILDKLGDVDGALTEFCKARDIFEKSCGRGHPTTATTYNNIGRLLRIKGNRRGALSEYFKVLRVQEKVLGKYHKETAQTYNHIGVLQYELGDSEALDNFHSALKILTELLPPDHPNIEKTKQAIALVSSSLS